MAWTESIDQAESNVGPSPDQTRTVAGEQPPTIPVGGGGRRPAPLLPLPLLALVASTVLVWLAPGSAQAAVLPSADLQLVGAVEEGPPAAGVTTADALSYRLTVRNDGPAAIPAQSLLLVVFVERSGGADPVTIEVARFSHGQSLNPAPGGECGNGRRLVVQCTNAQAIAPGDEISLQITHRHPAAEAGALSLVAEVSRARNLFADPEPGNNSFRGPAYGFIDPPTTTTTTTMPDTTTTIDPSSTSSSSSTSESTSTSSTTTTSSSTTTSTTTTTTTTSTTASTTTSTTTLPSSSSTTSTSLSALTGSASLPTSPSQVQDVAGTSQGPGEGEAVAAPSLEQGSNGGPPYLLLAALAALVVMLGGIGLAAYAYFNRPPPLVDIRRFD